MLPKLVETLRGSTRDTRDLVTHTIAVDIKHVKGFSIFFFLIFGHTSHWIDNLLFHIRHY